MKALLRKIRGVLSIALTSAAAWGVIGAVVGIGLRLSQPGDFGVGESVVGIAARFAAAGLVAGGAFALILALAERRRNRGELSIPRATIWGAIGGAALPLLTPMADSMVMLLGPLGAAFAAAAIAIAKRGRDPETLLIDRGAAPK